MPRSTCRGWRLPLGVSDPTALCWGLKEEGRRGLGERANICLLSVCGTRSCPSPSYLPSPPTLLSGKLAFQSFLHPGLKFLGLWAVCVHLADGKIRALWASDLTLAAVCAAAGRVSVLWPPRIPPPFLAH